MAPQHPVDLRLVAAGGRRLSCCRTWSSGTAAPWRLNLEAIAANMDDLLGFPDVSALAYEGRALFVSGAGSDYIGRRYHGQICEVFPPQAEFAVIADSGHYPHVEQPQVFLKQITDFLESAYA
jgi:pimeloyl-ACP methyl ester carboxylesterase